MQAVIERFLPPRRLSYFLGFLICAGLIAYALYLQYVKHLDPCPLCLLQRIAIIAMGVVFLIAALHNPGDLGAKIYALLVCLVGASGAAIAARHVWIQYLPKDKVPECGPGLEFMLSTMPFQEVVQTVLHGSGECAEKSWQFLGLTIPGWTLVFFVLMSAASVALVWKSRK